MGKGNAPQTAQTVTTAPVNANEVTTVVKKSAEVQPGDSVLNDNAPAPEGTQQTSSRTQSTTTTTTTNPDGSTTRQDQDSATYSCALQGHDERTFGTVLEAHQAVWSSSGLLSALNLLKTLTWPSTLPVLTFTSPVLGSHAVDFNEWAGIFLTLRTLLIAGAGFAAYRIVFVGGH